MLLLQPNRFSCLTHHFYLIFREESIFEHPEAPSVTADEVAATHHFDAAHQGGQSR